MKHILRIDKNDYEIDVKTIIRNNREFIDLEDLAKAKKQIALIIAKKNIDPPTTVEFNYLVSACGLKNAELAQQVRVEPVMIMLWRKELLVSKVDWYSLRIFFLMHFALELQLRPGFTTNK